MDGSTSTSRPASSCSLTGPNGSGKTTLLRLVAGLLAPTGGTLEVAVERAQVGFLGHEPLVYRELTPLENLELYGRLYRIPSGGSGSARCSSGSGSGRCASERVSTFSRGMQQRLGLCRALLHEPELVILDEPFNALDAQGVELLERELAGLRRPDRARRDPRAGAGRAARDARGWRSHELRRRRRRARPQGPAARAAGARDGAVAAPVRDRRARRLPLRAARRLGRRRRPGTALGRDRLHRAARADPRVRRRSASRGCSTRSCSRPCDRSAIWAAKSLAVLAFLGDRRARRAARLRRLLLGRGRDDGRRRRARRPRDLRRRHAGRRDGRRRPRARAARAAALPAARDPDRRRRRRRQRHAASRATSASSRSTTRSSCSSPGPPSSTWSPSSMGRGHAAREPADGARGADDRARRRLDRARLLLRPERRRPGLLAADLLLPRARRADRVRRASAGAPGRRCSTSGSGRRAPTSRATSRSTRD